MGNTRCCCLRSQPRCLLPAEKPGICPLAEEAPLAPCGTACTKDWQCPGAQKCCSSSRCGSVCSAPEPGEEMVARAVIPPGMVGSKLLGTGCGTALPQGRHSGPGPGHPEAAQKEVPATQGDPSSCCLFLPLSEKPGECPKVRPQHASEPCTEMDSCSHDRDCSRQEKCCFSGCAMHCTRPAQGERGSPATSTGKRCDSGAGTPVLGLRPPPWGWDPHRHPRPLLGQSTPGSARGQGRAGSCGAGAGGSAWMTASAGEGRSAVTLAAAGSAWPCPQVEGTACSGEAGHSPPRAAR